MRTVSFTKFVAAGNDFIVIDNRSGILKGLPQTEAIRLCDRRFGVGADGVLLLERSRKADIRMRIFNPDGSQADMCGNGVRCLSKFVVGKKIVKSEHTVETGAGIIRSRVRGWLVRSLLTEPGNFRDYPKFKVGGRSEDVHFLNTGVPHAVIVRSSLKDLDVASRGRELRYHKVFAPAGTNVNFMRIGPGNAIQVRTYERGVEAETLACGTGSTASALTASRLRGLRSPVRVITRGGENLKVYFNRRDGRFTDVYLEGPVRSTFEGRVHI
jgi:diaminopimelate epimerase